jgi:hypothetical protein
MGQPTHPTAQARGRFTRLAADEQRARLERLAVSARREAYRRAHVLAADLTELLGQLDARRGDPSERVELQESARLAVGTIVRLLAAPSGGVPPVRRTSTDPGELDAWVRLLDELLTDAQVGYDGAQDRALGLAAAIAEGVDHLAGVEAGEGNR